MKEGEIPENTRSHLGSRFKSYLASLFLQKNRIKEIVESEYKMCNDKNSKMFHIQQRIEEWGNMCTFINGGDKDSFVDGLIEMYDCTEEFAEDMWNKYFDV